MLIVFHDVADAAYAEVRIAGFHFLTECLKGFACLILRLHDRILTGQGGQIMSAKTAVG